VNYYFGNADTLATLDVTRDYNRGLIAASGSATVGNFGTVAGARNETGLVDGADAFEDCSTKSKSSRSIDAGANSGRPNQPAAPPAALAFTSEPVDARVLAGRDVTFSGLRHRRISYSLSWQRDEVDISVQIMRHIP